MLRVASQSNVPPYCALTAGPNSHSPVPMDAPASRTPGPSKPAHMCHPPRGGSGKSPSPHGGSAPAGTVSSSLPGFDLDAWDEPSFDWTVSLFMGSRYSSHCDGIAWGTRGPLEPQRRENKCKLDNPIGRKLIQIEVFEVVH